MLNPFLTLSTLSISENDVKLYVAYHCDCRNWLSFGPVDVGKAKTCWFCGKVYVMDADGDVSEAAERGE